MSVPPFHTLYIGVDSLSTSCARSLLATGGFSPAVSGVALSGLSLSGVSSRDRIDSPAAHSRVSDATDGLPLADGVPSTLSGIFFCRLPPFPTLSRHAF